MIARCIWADMCGLWCESIINERHEEKTLVGKVGKGLGFNAWEVIQWT